mmetsp:Transcript_21301/g.57320  ORF Transcript_21301/g.57320 Transcript_21301/m.57320 type:complete len:385 (-) Transcript_21301:78-1232(-)
MATHADRAQVMLRGAVDASPESPLAWALVAVMYTQQGREYDARRSFKYATSLTGNADRLNLDLAESLVHLCAEPLVAASLDLHLASTRKSNSEAPEDRAARICRARARLLAQRYPEAETLLAELVTELPGNAELAAGLGHARFAQGRYDEALEAYQQAVDADANARDATTHLRISQICTMQAEASPPGPAQQARWARARDAALLASKFEPSSTTWLTVGVACLALHATSEAEEALSEACVLNNRNSLVWAHLCLLTLKAGREGEAAESLKQALRLGLSEASLLQRIGAEYLQLGQWSTSEDALRRAVAAGAGAKALLFLADCLADKGETTEAIATYERLLVPAQEAASEEEGPSATPEPLTEAEERHVRARLAQLQAATGRAAQ